MRVFLRRIWPFCVWWCDILSAASAMAHADPTRPTAIPQAKLPMPTVSPAANRVYSDCAFPAGGMGGWVEGVSALHCKKQRFECLKSEAKAWSVIL